MKRVNLLLFSLLLSIVLFTSAKCNKDEDDEPTLPPETTTGAMTFGCKVNGQVFVPRDGNGRPGLFAQYVNLGTGPGGMVFGLNANNWKEVNIPTVRIKTDSLLFVEGITYTLKIQKGFANGEYDKGSDFYMIQSSETGQLIITKHDQAQRILSGRFSFNANSQNGQKVSITEGRFDIRY